MFEEDRNVCIMEIYKESTLQVPKRPDKVEPSKVSHVMPTIIIVLVAYSPLISHKGGSCFISSLNIMPYAKNLHILVSGLQLSDWVQNVSSPMVKIQIFVFIYTLDSSE